MLSYSIFLIFLLFIILLIKKLYFSCNFEKFENLNVNIGNQICIYFYNLGKSIFDEKDFYYNENKNVFFLKDLPTYIKYDKKLKEIRDKLLLKLEKNFLDNIYSYSLWEIFNEKKEYFWLCIKDLVYNILNDTFIKCNLVKNIEYPIIHFRCSDVPFNKHPNYKFQYYSYYRNALKYIKNKSNINYNKVYISYNNNWSSNDNIKNSCDIYYNEIKKYIESLGYEVLLLNGSDIDDFSSMFYAPAVISPSSSFSFMSGFFNKGIFVSAGHYNNKNKKCNNCKEWLFKGYDLDHHLIDDYNNTEKVIKLLKR